MNLAILSFIIIFFQNEPGGFRGINWGTDISTLDDMLFIRDDPSYGGMKVYKRKNDTLKIGEANVKSIEYTFWRGKFSHVAIEAVGYNNWLALKDACEAKFGKPISNPYIEQYVWHGETTDIYLKYNDTNEKSILYVSSVQFIKEKQKYQKEKAKSEDIGF